MEIESALDVAHVSLQKETHEFNRRLSQVDEVHSEAIAALKVSLDAEIAERGILETRLQCECMKSTDLHVGMVKESQKYGELWSQYVALMEDGTREAAELVEELEAEQELSELQEKKLAELDLALHE